jgi:hypothetical protein
MRAALFVHLLCVAGWTGCVLVEGIYEHSIDQSAPMRRFVSELHWRTDKYVEIPAFLGALLTGLFMVGSVAMTPLLATKITFGLIAVVVNAYCVWLVLRRLRLARAGDFSAWETIDDSQHKFGAVVLIGLAVALSIGGYLFAIG